MTEQDQPQAQSPAVRAELLAQLREASADKPYHRAFLEALITWHSNGQPGGPDAEPHPEDYANVTFDVGVDLQSDVHRAFWRTNMGGGLAYPERRRKGRAAAGKRQRTMDSMEYQLNARLKGL